MSRQGKKQQRAEEVDEEKNGPRIEFHPHSYISKSYVPLMNTAHSYVLAEA